MTGEAAHRNPLPGALATATGYGGGVGDLLFAARRSLIQARRQVSTRVTFPTLGTVAPDHLGDLAGKLDAFGGQGNRIHSDLQIGKNPVRVHRYLSFAPLGA